MRLRFYTSMVAIVGLSMALGQTARSAEFDLDFETDPADLGVEFHGTAEWRDSDGVADSGYLSITDALNSQRGAIVFPDLENGAEVKAFSITADLRVGGGTDRPADGFSFNFTRPDDPVLDDGEDWAASPTGEANLPEEGTTTGLAIGFDEWFSGGADVEGMSIRIDNVIANEFAFPVRNGAVDNTESLQTVLEEGTTGVFDDELQDAMGFAKLEIEFCAGNLNVQYKGVQVFDEPVNYAASPGQLVFGGRTGGANAYHHIDNVSIKTNDDTGAGCVAAIETFPVAGRDTIGSDVRAASEENRMFGPPMPGASGFNVKLVDVQDFQVADHTTAEGVLEDDDGDVTTASYPFVDIGGGAGTFPDTQPYPNGVTDDSMEDFALQATADVTIPAGEYTIGFGSDDGGQITIAGITFDEFSDPNDSFDDDQIRFEGNRGHGWTVGSFTVSEETETTIVASMHERGGGDSFEIAITEGTAIEAANPNDWELLANGTLGWEVTHTGRELESADLVSEEVTSQLALEFDVNGDTGESDALTVDNPDPNVFTTVMDLGADLEFVIKATGSLSDGQRFKVVDADQITGETPTITPLVPPGQVWDWDGTTGEICVTACGDVPSGGDYNMDGVLDAADLDLQSAEMKKDVADQDLAAFDHNGDNVVNDSDRTIWVKDLRNTWVGDANMDDEFNSGDLVAVFAAGKYETGEMAGWAEGDWNGDMAFDSGDLVVAFADGGYEQGPAAAGAVAAVPEPSSIVLALLSVLGVVGIVRRRNG